MSRVCPECGQEYPDGTDRCPEDGAKTFVVGSGDDLVGKRIDGRFTITSLLGKGGMGAVYRAHQHSMDREVALKVMRRDLASVPDAVKRFFREAKAASKLHNPHAITVFDFGQTDDGLLYIVMELLFGQSLAEVVKKTSGPMDPKRAINIVLQVLTALADAHAIGVLHRDLKPDNIFLMDGEATNDFVKVLDFGIAKILGSDGTSLTGTGMLFGTPTYMSPEQATGEELDTRSDLYAVGVILFELLAGKPPFQEKTPVALLVKKANENAPSIFHVNPEVKIPKGLPGIASGKDDYRSDVATLPDGGFVVVWVTNGNDGDGYGLSAQRFTADGTPNGTELQVNVYSTADQYMPKIAGLSDGGFLITWASEGQDGDILGVYAQMFNADGTRRRTLDPDGDGVMSPVDDDEDNDGYNDTSDCYDLNADAYPGQTDWFPEHRGDLSFDYDCDEAETKRWTNLTSWTCNLLMCTNHDGWETSVPDCGETSVWTLGCQWEYMEGCHISAWEWRVQECH